MGGVLDAFLSFVVPGLGMFVESYVIFGTGQAKILWHDEYPTCWTPNISVDCLDNVQCNGLFNITDLPFDQCAEMCTHETCQYPPDMLCNRNILNSISYMEFAGIMTSMLIMGILADKLGRKLGSSINSLLMFFGIILLSASYHLNLNIMFLMFSIGFGTFGLGVGGEYPVAAASASEMTEAHDQLESSVGKIERGKAVTLVFSMQGWGPVVYGLFLVISLTISGAGQPRCTDHAANEHGYNANSLAIMWRCLYIIAIPIVFATLIYRAFYLSESEVWLRGRERATRMDSALSWIILKKTVRIYGLRLIGTTMSWFCWDVAFYGNKLFTDTIFAGLVPSGALLARNAYILLNSTIALLGYYVSAFTIDKPWMGRLRIQVMGFFMTAVLFLLCYWQYNNLSSHMMLFLYILSSFFGQFGPNATTFVLPSEIFPTEIRTLAHGLSALFGKAGALLGTIIFAGRPAQTLFLISGIVSVIGLLFSVLFIPEVMNLSLEEQDQRFSMVKSDKGYSGECVNPKNLSFAEIWAGHAQKYSSLHSNDDRELEELQSLSATYH